MAQRREIEIGDLFRKIGPNQPVWRVISFLRIAPLPHAKLQKLDAAGTQMTIGIAALLDPHFFEPVSKPETT